MGIVYSALIAAAPNNKIVGSILTPINMLINGYHWCLTPVYKVWGSDIIQGAIRDALMVNDLYIKYLFPYIMYGTFLIAAFGPDTFGYTQRFMKLQIRYQIDSEIEYVRLPSPD